MEQRRDWKEKGFVEHYNALYGIPDEDARRYLEELGFESGDVFIDLGCGDGGMLALAAARVRRAVGVDCSPHQVGLSRERLAGRANAEVVEARFLDFDARGETFTKGFSRKALHHLTDPEKETFLRRLSASFAPGALLLIEDGMFEFDRDRLAEQMPRVLQDAEAYFGKEWEAKRGDFLHMLEDEFPTGQDFWAAAVEKAGFRVVKRWSRNCFYGGLLARKEA